MLPQGSAEHSPEEILADCDLTTARKGKTMTKHTTGDGEVERDLRKMKPYGGSGYYHPGPANEADRVAVNKWIREPGHFDAVIDFDKLTADPAHPDQMLPAYDSGDHLHPSPAGYRIMGNTVPTSVFAH